LFYLNFILKFIKGHPPNLQWGLASSKMPQNRHLVI
jgi:hypothetical protein